MSRRWKIQRHGGWRASDMFVGHGFNKPKYSRLFLWGRFLLQSQQISQTAMKPKLIHGLALVLSGVWFGCSTAALPIRYHNAQYDLAFYLPTDWKNYSVLTQQWNGEKYAPDKDAVVTMAHGPIIVLRNPQWKTNNLYQDIPIYIFTRQQWDDINLGKYYAQGAGGVIYELWHNDKYVFCIHSRYNANDSLNGWKEVQDIVNQNCAAHPEPHLHDI